MKTAIRATLVFLILITIACKKETPTDEIQHEDLSVAYLKFDNDEKILLGEALNCSPFFSGKVAGCQGGDTRWFRHEKYNITLVLAMNLHDGDTITMGRWYDCAHDQLLPIVEITDNESGTRYNAQTGKVAVSSAGGGYRFDLIDMGFTEAQDTQTTHHISGRVLCSNKY